ncbi:hypothetical protein ACQKCJ_02745 [Flavobacterium sp. NPDC079362]|uniref:hypothetical protein n=1 Tax=Flavobacterium sp. NPDC079362 TaxID=3390566 RepID=UPI003CFFD7EA
MRKIILPIFYILLLISCRENEHQKEKTTISATSKINLAKESANSEKKNINHLFVANGGSVLYMKNGERRSQARFDTDGNFVEELLKVAREDGKYKDYDNYLMEEKDSLNFFEDFGRIKSDWLILKGNEITNKQQVVSFTSPKNKNSQDVRTVESTQLILFNPEIKHFNDENSVEAESYFTAMDDWAYYSNELREFFKKKGVKSSYNEKRYLEFKIENNKTILIDTKSKINNYTPNALLYKKGKTPIILHLIASDNDPDEIQSYLK